MVWVDEAELESGILELLELISIADLFRLGGAVVITLFSSLDFCFVLFLTEGMELALNRINYRLGEMDRWDKP